MISWWHRLRQSGKSISGLALMLAGALVCAAPLASAWATTSAAITCPPLLAAATPAQLQAAERDRGMLWRATRDGRSLYLFGTLHVGKPSWRRFGPKTAAALRASDVLALEIDPFDPTLAQAMAELRPPQPLPTPLQQRLERAFQRACMASEALALLHPVLQATTLTVLESRWMGLDPAWSLEQGLATQARAWGLRVISLESVEQQTRALIPDDEEQALQMLDQSLQQLEDRSTRRVLARLATAWEQGDLAALEDYASWCECIETEDDRSFMRRLNDERNPLLADGIEAQHRAGRRVFAAVGALHMTGPQSLPRLLAQRGFAVERIAFVDIRR